MTSAADQFDPPLTPDLLLAAYEQGAFPMADSRGSRRVGWYVPRRRGIIPIDQFNCPRSVRKRIRDRAFDVRIDTAFEQTIRCCAGPRRAADDTWINERIVQAYIELHRRGIAHSVEAWLGDRMVGGLYGLAIGGAFFGESMFHDAAAGGTDASKVCLVHLVEHLRKRGFALLDAQMPNDHLVQFGLIVLDHAAFIERLENALPLDVHW